MRRAFLSALAVGLLAVAAGQAQLVTDFNPPRSNCCLPGTAKTLADQLQDWNQLGRYHAANEDLKKQPADAKRVVFMGDSITDGWRLADYFPGKPYVNRGISGQTTPQMLVRMVPDVVDLKPAAMVVLAGTNDIAGNTGPETAEMIQGNIMAMTDIATRHGIKVVLCAVLPVSDYPFQNSQNAPPAQGAPAGGRGMMMRPRMTGSHPPTDILKLNAWMKDYAAKNGAIYADYYAATVDEKGWLKESISADGLHPNAEGYKLMVPVVEAAIQKALQ